MAGGNPESANGYPPPAFRPDIQVLRAFAVVAVMLYHVDLAVFQGGFLGVDVFFVVSGYVIANKILHELRAGTFSFAGFYVSRLRRILPAAAVTVILVLIAGAILLPVSDFRALGRSALLAQLWVANIGFWLESGYFDQVSYLKPLLHLWSLSVEEQFYLFWPMILVVAFRFARRLVLPIVITVGVASIVACELVRPQVIHPH